MAATTLRGWLAYGLGPALAIATAPLLARALGPEGRGTLAAVLQPMTVADAVAAAGVPAAVTYYVARNYERKAVLRAARNVYLPLGLMVAAVLLAWAIYLNNTGVVPLYLTIIPWCVVVPVGAYIASRRGLWQGIGRYDYLDAERALSPIVRTVLVGALFLIGVTYAGPYLAAYVIASLSAAILLFRSPPRPQARDLDRGRPNVRSVESFSLKASAGTIAIALNNRLDQAILPALISLADLGAYAVGVAVAEVPTVFSAIMARNMMSESARSASRRQLTRTALTGGLAILVSSAGIAATAPWLVPFAFGDDFRSAVAPVIILSISTAVASVGIAVSAVLIGKGRPMASSVCHGSGAIVTVLLYLVFADSVTLIGACWISVAAQAVVSLTSLVLFAANTNKGKVRS